MSEITPNSKGPAPIQGTPETTEPALIPADQVKPEDVGTLSIEYRDGQPVIVVSGGKAIPATISAVDENGAQFASFTAQGGSLAFTSDASTLLWIATSNALKY
ncbi:hypothetical protein [Streptomyces sp. NPDC056069]|uniref:hypothetical protein n=1 Tax=Streptomyces sp. NPDC056069 TaxID=3345702 RepID=UPI0035D5D8FC